MLVNTAVLCVTAAGSQPVGVCFEPGMSHVTEDGVDKLSRNRSLEPPPHEFLPASLSLMIDFSFSLLPLILSLLSCI